jgi:glycerophosphoryl diester phosphodiesterase
MNLKRLLVLKRLLLLLIPVVYISNLQAESATLVKRAVLPATTFADGPTSGTQIGKGAINGVSVPFVKQQPVQGFSAVLAQNDGSFLVMSDNGFGTLANSADYHLRVYTIRPNFKTKQGGTGQISVIGFMELSDPNRKIPFTITQELTSKRILTGADFDIESFQQASDGTFWFGDEFGPFLLHTDAQGVVLEPPIPLPDFDNPGKEIRSPQNPFNEEGSTLRILNALAHHAQSHGHTKMLILSPDYRLLRGSFKAKHENRGYNKKEWCGLKAAASSIFDNKSIQKAGYRVVPWTINDKSDMLALMALGINGIISDRPDLLLQAVREFDANGNGVPGDFLTINGLIDFDQFDAQGHRGGRNLRPENTLPAMEVGLDYLMTTLETDIGITKDGIPVLKHDPYIRSNQCRYADGKTYTPADEILIKDLTLAEIQSNFICDQNPGRGETQKNEHNLSPVTMDFIETTRLKHPYAIPSLQQLFDFVDFYVDYYQNRAEKKYPEAIQRWQNAEQVRFNIETKINPRSDQDNDGSVYKEQTVGFEFMADTLARTIIANDMAERATIQSFDFRTNIRVQEHFSQIQTSYLIGDFPKVSANDCAKPGDHMPNDYVENGDNLQDENGKNTPWLGGLYWPYRVTVREQPFRAKTSGGFEGMAITPDGNKLITMLEKPLKKRCCGSKKGGILLMHEFDIASRKYTGIHYQYQLSARGTAIGDFVLFTQNQGLVIERDNSQGDMNGLKMIYKITLPAAEGMVEKSPLVNLLKIADPNHISQGQSGDIGIGTTFGLPFFTIEGIVILSPNQIGVLNDNNYPFSVGRHVGSGLPDDNEFIIIELDEELLQ